MKDYVIVAGANGSGKSTLIKNICGSEQYKDHIYICADEIEKLMNTEFSQTKMETARDIAIKYRTKELENGNSIIYESVFSHPSHLQDLEQIKNMGYNITSFYIATESPEINIERIANRGRENDSYLTPERVSNRYQRSLDLLVDLIKKSDISYIYDNSVEYVAVFYKENEKFYLIDKTKWVQKYIVDKLEKDNQQVEKVSDVTNSKIKDIINCFIKQPSEALKQ